MALFHNLRLLYRMKKPAYTEPALGWNDEYFKVGLVKYGIAEYAAPMKKKIEVPTRPEITFEPFETPIPFDAPGLKCDAPEPLQLM